jgi:hypothetical protein
MLRYKPPLYAETFVDRGLIGPIVYQFVFGVLGGMGPRPRWPDAYEGHRRQAVWR